MQLTYVSSIEVGTVLSAIGFAKARLGVAVLPGYVRQFVADLGLVARPLPEAPIKHRISLITRWNARLSTPAERLADTVRQALSKAAP